MGQPSGRTRKGEDGESVVHKMLQMERMAVVQQEQDTMLQVHRRMEWASRPAGLEKEKMGSQSSIRCFRWKGGSC